MKIIYLYLLMLLPFHNIFNEVNHIGVPEIHMNGVSKSGDKLELEIFDYTVDFKIKAKLFKAGKEVEFVNEFYGKSICDFDNKIFTVVVSEEVGKKECQLWILPETLILIESQNDSWFKYKFKAKFSYYTNEMQGNDIIFNCTLIKNL